MKHRIANMTGLELTTLIIMGSLAVGALVARMPTPYLLEANLLLFFKF